MQETISRPIFLCTFSFVLYLLVSLTSVEEVTPHTVLSFRAKAFISEGGLHYYYQSCCFFFSFFLQSTGTDFTATEIEPVAVDAGHSNLILQNVEQASPYPAVYINNCLAANILIITDFKESFTLHTNINYG